MKLSCLFFCCVMLLQFGTGHAQPHIGIHQWVTYADRSKLFSLQPTTIAFTGKATSPAIITVNDTETFQSIDGFGFALTGGSAQPIVRMSPGARTKLLKKLFGTSASSSQAGISYLRLSIGASDLNEFVFSYDDLPAGTTDTAMQHFNLGPDKQDVVPVMKEILRVNPAIKILASPWSPPAWMKTNNDARGGRLKPIYYAAYALYFVKYIQAMKKEGITIDAITVQNEPLHPGNNPSLLLTAPDEADFIKNHLGPAFTKAGIRTKIILYDHNADRSDYPILIMDDPAAKKYVDGSGFHLYGGQVSALTDVHNAHPDKHIYFTEQMIVGFNDKGVDVTNMDIADPVGRVVIGATRNWSKNVIAWNLAADPQFKPFTDRGGCNVCQGAITIDKDSVTYNLAYYAIVHASKFVLPGSKRIASNETEHISNVAFKTPAGKLVVVAANTSSNPQTFDIKYKNQYATFSLPGRSAATYVW